MIETGQSLAAQHDIKLSKRSIALLKAIESQPGATPNPMGPPKSSIPNVLIYKVMGKMFAIMSIRGEEGVIVKCEEDQVLFLKDQYEGVGHRSHLDKRFWISVKLNSDVPAKEVVRLVQQSYELICAKLTKKQKAELLLL